MRMTLTGIVQMIMRGNGNAQPEYKKLYPLRMFPEFYLNHIKIK